jgi:hypothetical protein
MNSLIARAKQFTKNGFDLNPKLMLTYKMHFP